MLSALIWAGSRPQGLLALPTEVLLLIMEELEWDDVIRLRTTCKTLQGPTYSKELWSQLFRRYLESSMPTPFILPKAFHECSSTELEQIVWKSKASLRIRQPLQVDKHSLKIPNSKIGRLHLVPGGRWLLVGCHDGSVWWFDLDLHSSPEAQSWGAGGPNLLLESPLPANEASENFARVEFSIDYTSENSDPNTVNQFKPLEHFNLAVFVSYQSPNLDYTTNSFQIWKVDVVTGSENGSVSGIKAHQCLSSFFEDTICCTITSFSLHGVNLAYSLAAPRQITIVVDWSVVNGKRVGVDSGFMRWYLQPAAATRVFLLSGDLLLVLSPTVLSIKLWKWRQSATYSDLPPSRVWNLPGPMEPFWQYKLPDWPCLLNDMLPPVKVDGRFQCTVATIEDGVFLLCIPDDAQNLSPSSIACKKVYTGDLKEPKKRCSPFGFRYSLIYVRNSGWTLIPYEDNSVGSHSSANVSHVPKSKVINNPRQILLDQHSHRIVVSDLKAYYSAYLTSPFPVAPSSSSSVSGLY